MVKEKLVLQPDRFFDPVPSIRKTAIELYELVKDMPIISPHGHVNPEIFVNPDTGFGNPVSLLITPDHYLTRMLYSQGVSFEDLGIQSVSPLYPPLKKGDKIWQIFAENFYLFNGTPTGIWFNYILKEIFEVKYKLTGETAVETYNIINNKLKTPEFTPRRMFEKFNIEVLATTDESYSTLEHHKAIKDSGWQARIIPTFRVDSIMNICNPGWKENIGKLSKSAGIEITDYKSFIESIKKQRTFFKKMGATSIDFSVETPYTEELSFSEADSIFTRAMKGKLSGNDSVRFAANMIMELAGMSIEDGLVMQMHCGILRNHNQQVFEKYGPDKGCDIPVQTEFTKNLKPLLNKYGNNTELTIIIFTLDESTYSRELAPLAGHYPALKLGPPWWFHDSINGMVRFRERIIETAGLYNTTGFVDDTRAFLSIPARHDLARRIDSNWLAGLISRKIIDKTAGFKMIKDCAYNLAKKTYNL